MKNYLAGGALLLILVAWAASCMYSHHRGVNAGLSECAAQLTTGDRKNANVCTKAADNVVAAANGKAQKDARDAEQQHIEDFAKAEMIHQQEMKDAQKKASSTVASLRAGTIQLRDEWAACERATAGGLSAPVPRPAELDELAKLREQDQGALVQIGAEADAQVRAYQAILRAERAAVTPRQ
jgi:hypothetical protein